MYPLLLAFSLLFYEKSKEKKTLQESDRIKKRGSINDMLTIFSVRIVCFHQDYC